MEVSFIIAVWILLETGNQIIHQALGRNFHPPPGGVAIGENTWSTKDHIIRTKLIP